jgi:hypothetical protein
MTDLTIDRIRSIGGLVTAKTERVDITWTGTDPSTGERTEYTHTVEIRRMAFGWIDRVTREVRKAANGHDEAQSIGATLIAGGVLFGGESLSYTEALQLEPSLANELLRAFYTVNGMRVPADPEDPENSAKN